MNQEKDPTRLSRSGSPIEVALLRSSKEDRLDRRQRRRLLAGLGVAGGMGLAGPAAAKLGVTTAGAGKTGIVAVAGKLVGVLAVSGAIAVGSVQAVRSLHPNPPRANETPTRSAAEVAPPSTPPPSAASAAPEGPSLSTRRPTISGAPSRKTTVPGPALAAEVQSVERIRALVESRNSKGAFEQLARHRRTFHSGALAVEADVLEIEALLLDRRAHAAQIAGRNFLHQNPGSPYTARVRALLGELQSGEAAAR